MVGWPSSTGLSSPMALSLPYLLRKLERSDSPLSSAPSPYRRSLSESLPDVVLLGDSAAARTARWIDAYSLAEEKADRARVRWIISGLLVASAMSCERSSRCVMRRW